MLIRKIRQVILFLLSNISILSSIENNGFIYPKEKPSVFKKKVDKINIEPKEKPKSNKNIADSKKFLKPKKKPDSTKPNKEKIQKVIDIEKKITSINKDIFVYPKKKPNTYKAMSNIEENSKILKKKEIVSH